MFDEEILLLIKQDRHTEALEKYVIKDLHDEALNFCLSKDKSPGLLTTLLEIYFSNYEKGIAQSKILEDRGKVSESITARNKAAEYSKSALKLLNNEKSKDSLNPKTVLNKIPEDWDIITNEYNLISLLSSLFDH